MAKSLKHTAIDPNGVKHTRTSQSRVYAYTVVARSNYARDVAMAGKLFEQDRRNFDFYTKMVAWGGAYEGVKRSWETPEYYAAETARYAAEVEKYKDRDTCAVMKRAERIADVEARKAAGHYDRYNSLGWCSRMDLAQKLAAGQSHLCDVTILIAEIA